MILNFLSAGKQALKLTSCTLGKSFAWSGVSVRPRSDSLAFRDNQTLSSFCQLVGTKKSIARLLYQQLNHFIHAFSNSLCRGCDGGGTRIMRAGLEGGKIAVAYGKPALSKSANLTAQVCIHLRRTEKALMQLGVLKTRFLLPTQLSAPPERQFLRLPAL